MWLPALNSSSEDDIRVLQGVVKSDAPNNPSHWLIGIRAMVFHLGVLKHLSERGCCESEDFRLSQGESERSDRYSAERVCVADLRGV